MKNIFHCSIIAIILFSCSTNKKQSQDYRNLERRVDSMVRPYIDRANVAGMDIAVYKNKEPILHKAYGMADLEFNVKMPADASFEIGSVTKQFTGAAICQLAEAGKLGLDDDITKYLAFNTQGNKVTIRNLLNHTSGLKSYTELPVFGKLNMFSYNRDTILRLLEKEPFDFTPGDELIYSNSGFFMLGLIIEKVSGLSYEEYVKKNLFDKAGMRNSYYGSETRVIKNRAHGYDVGEMEYDQNGNPTGKSKLAHSAYLDHTWPFAAGSLCSTTGDLVEWNDALHHGRILGEKMYKEFITPAVLNDGTKTHYAMGITLSELDGKRLISHGGGINGYLSQNSYFPDDNISIVVLINTTGPVSPNEIADHIADFVFGKAALKIGSFNGDVSIFPGTYGGAGRGENFSVIVTKNDSALSIKLPYERKPKDLQYLPDSSWTDGSWRYWFRGTGNSMDELRIDQTYGYLILKKEK
jgi:CubicO group peptidase (beta-lactamase class C family)